MAKIKTEKSWLSSTTPHSLLFTLRGKRMKRQRRLVAVALCRRLLEEMIDPESRDAVEVAERYADGLADTKELGDAHRAAQRVASQRIEASQTATASEAGRAWSVWRLAYAAQLTCAPSGLSDVASELITRALRLGSEQDAQERKRNVCEFGTSSGIHFVSDPQSIPPGYPGMAESSPNWPGRFMTSGSCPPALWTAAVSSSWPTPWKKPAAPTRTSWTIAAGRASTSAAAGCSTCSWEKSGRNFRDSVHSVQGLR